MGDSARADDAARPPGMRTPDTEVTEEDAVLRVHTIVQTELRWIFRGDRLPDYGIDAFIEVRGSPDRVVTGRLIALQIKGGPSQFAEPHPDGWTFRDHSDHLAYWLGHSLPVVVVIVDAAGNGFWEKVTSRTV